MLDRWMRPLIDPPLNRLGRSLARAGLHANSITLLGLALGLVAAGLIGFGQMTAALVLLLASRVADGLDGAVARATTPTDFGGYLDICADFLFYGAIPMGVCVAGTRHQRRCGGVLIAQLLCQRCQLSRLCDLSREAWAKNQYTRQKIALFHGRLA